MSNSSKNCIIILGIMLLVMAPLAACSSSEDSQPVTQPTGEVDIPVASSEPTIVNERVIITIGNHTDLTGVAANAMSVITMALKDTADYYNEQNLIPGVTIKVIDYDNQYDPSKDMVGYEWLKQNGADVIFSGVAATGLTLKPILEDDKTVMIMMSPNTDAFVPPGWVFALGNALYEEQIYTLLDWIANNDPDFPTDRPAKIGGAMFGESAGIAILTAAEEYAEANPEEYEWVDGFLTDFKFIWQAEAELLKDCDYVFPTVPPPPFVTAYQDVDGKGKFLGTDAHVAFMGMVGKADLWEAMDGMYVVRPFSWWTDDGVYMDLTRDILNENHTDSADEIMQEGVGYLTVMPAVMLLEAIKGTVEEVGAANFASEHLYDYLIDFSMEFDGCHHSFSNTKRTSNDYLNIHELDAERKDLFRAHEEWIPIVNEP